MKNAEIKKVRESFFDFMRKSTLVNKQNIKINTAAKQERNQTIAVGDMAIYFPKTPDVLINSVANNKPETCFK